MSSQVQDNPKTYGKWQPRTLYYWLARVGSKTTWTILVLVILNVVCYATTIDGYFLADDFIHVSYLFKVFNGHPELLLENFYTNWMQTEGTQFYRPVISLSLAFDYLFWAQNAKGYHLSNLVYQILCSIGVFLVAKRIFITDLRGKPKEKEDKPQTEEEAPIESPKDGVALKKGSFAMSRLSPDHVYTINFTALLAACIFSVHPLHPEVVSWIIGRVDSVCTAAYLFSLWLFLVSIQSNSSKVKKSSKIASLLIFAIALCSKEMAVTLPPTLVLLLLFFQTPVYGRAKSIWMRITNAFRASWHYWVLLILYLIVRTLSLGEFVGGYGGSIGEGFASTIFERLLSERSIHRIMFPLNMEVFSPDTKVINQLRILYCSIIGTFVLALLISRSKDTVIKSVIFTSLWFVLIMIPTIPVWNLTDSLQSSRFIYMGTVPLSIILALLICPLSRYGRRVIRQREKTNLTLRVTQDTLKGLSSLIAIILVVSFVSITIKNNSSWARAGEEVKALRAQVYNCIDGTKSSKDIALLNLPNKYKGAHMIYNGSMMQVLLTPPLSKTNVQNRLLTFEPAMYGDSDLVRASRLRKLIQDSPNTPIYKWNRNTLELNRIDFNRDNQSEFVTQLNTPVKLKEGSLLVSPALSLGSLNTDSVEVDINITQARKKGKLLSGEPIPFILYWMPDSDKKIDKSVFLAKLIDPAKAIKQTLHFDTSQHKKWIEKAKIARLAFAIGPNKNKIAITALRCRRLTDKLPSLELGKGQLATDVRGIINIGPKVGSINLNFDTSKIADSKQSFIEVSKPNSWFEHYSGTFRDKVFSDHSMLTKKVNQTVTTNYNLELSKIKASGFYQVRVIALTDTGKPAGYFSDPLVLQVAR